MNRSTRYARYGVGALSLLMLSAMTACRGSRGGADNALAPANAPAWVNHGSRIEKGSIFGVGSTAGVKNTELSRKSAENRARSEISKILETYSASLMKDYQESVTAGDLKKSSESQMVTNAIKTFSAGLQQGAEPKEFWFDANHNTWYSLVELNFERSKEVAAAKAKMDSGMKEWLDRNGGKVLDDLERTTDQGRPPATAGEGGGGASPPTAQGSPPPPLAPVRPTAPPSAPVAPPVSEGPPAKIGGPAPGWTQGACSQQQYLCGVGDGRDRTSADLAARAELARIFQSNISSVAKSFEGAARQISSKTGETWAEAQNVSQFSMVSTNKTITMSEILERWDDGKGRLWSLAVIDRAQAGAALRDQIQAKDGVVGSQLDRARGAQDKLAKLKALKSAVAALAEREALNSDLRVIQKSGGGIPSPHNIGEIVAMLDSATEALSIGIALSGSGADRVQACLEEAMTTKGYQVQSNTVEEEDDDPKVSGTFDVLIKGTVKNEKRDKIAGSEVVNTTVTLKLINGKTKQTLRTFTGAEKASRSSVQAAASTSAFKVCQKQIPSIVGDIDRYFSR